MLDDIDKQILIDVYIMDFDHGPTINENNYELGEIDWMARKQAFVYRINSLCNLKYLKIDSSEGKYYREGGFTNLKYNNSAGVIYYSKIHIDDLGIELVKEIQKSKLKRVSEAIKKVITKALPVVVGFILGVATTVISALILRKYFNI